MVCPTTAFAAWDSMNLCVVLSFIARAVAANLTGPAAAVAQRAIPKNMSEEKAVKCSLLTGIYGVGSWEGVVEQEWDDTKLGHREDPRARKERLDQLAVVLGKSDKR